MFSHIGDLPLHPLAVHAAVVLIPLAAFLGILFVFPFLRHWARPSLILVSLVALASTYVSKESGQDLRSEGGQGAAGLSGDTGKLIDHHAHLAGQLWVLMIVYTVVAVVTALVAGGSRSKRSSSKSNGDGGSTATRQPVRDSSGAGALSLLLVGLTFVGAILVGIQTYRVGEAGAKAVWNPSGTTDYSSSSS